MKNLYKTLDEGRIGIFESPTGTVYFFLPSQLSIYPNFF
jgi:hypothetical protein